MRKSVATRTTAAPALYGACAQMNPASSVRRKRKLSANSIEPNQHEAGYQVSACPLRSKSHAGAQPDRGCIPQEDSRNLHSARKYGRGPKCEQLRSPRSSNLSRAARSTEIRFRGWLHQTGEMRAAPDSSWRTFAAEQVISVSRPGFAWSARMQAMPLLSAQTSTAMWMARGCSKPGSAHCRWRGGGTRGEQGRADAVSRRRT